MTSSVPCGIEDVFFTRLRKLYGRKPVDEFEAGIR